MDVGTLGTVKALEPRDLVETKAQVVLGNTYHLMLRPGAEVIAKKDIVIIGGLYGEAYAGADGESGHFIAALEMSPENLKIGDLTYKNDTKQSKWSIRPKMQPKIACEKGGKVVIEPVTKELLNMLPNSR